MALGDLLDAFAASDPVPGGGAAAALAGALGSSLLVMVAGLPRTRTGTAEQAADLAEASARLRPIRDRLTSLVDEDSAAGGATEAPMDTMRSCQQALRGAAIIAENGDPGASADTGTGVALLLAGLRGAGISVDVNLGSVGDPAFVERVGAERRQLAADGEADGRRAMDALQRLG